MGSLDNVSLRYAASTIRLIPAAMCGRARRRTRPVAYALLARHRGPIPQADRAASRLTPTGTQHVGMELCEARSLRTADPTALPGFPSMCLGTSSSLMPPTGEAV